MSRSRVIVEFPDRPAYPVRIGGGVVSQLGSDLRAMGIRADRCLVICDSDAAGRLLSPIKTALALEGFRVSDITIPAVELEQAWECVAELHAAFPQLDLSSGTPVVVAACITAAELAAFAVATYGGGLPLVMVPASLAAALRTVGVNRIELDAGYPVPLVAPATPAFAAVEPALLACKSQAEAELGLDELGVAAVYADADFRAWLAQDRAAIAAYDEDALVLALTQALASRADALGVDIAARK